MIQNLQIPGHEHFVSDVALREETLVVRLVADLHPASPGGAYELIVTSPEDAERAIQSLCEFKAQNSTIYASQLDDAVVLVTELSEELVLRGAAFSGYVTALNVREITEARDRVYQWYLAECEHQRKTQATLHRVRTLLTDQGNRIRVKANSHSEDSTAGVLYSQQLVFIERLLRESKA